MVTIAVRLDILTRTPELLVMEASYAAGESPPPPHYHPSQDEHFEVLEGSIALKIGHARSVVEAGESFDIPRGVAHALGPAGGPARVRWEVRPALRTAQFLTEALRFGPDTPLAEQLAHVQRYAEEIRLAGF
jgi:quercetin dioxygenase-like cupin family protein